MLSVFAQNDVPVTILCAPAGFGKSEALAEAFHRAAAGGVAGVWWDAEYHGQDPAACAALESDIQTAGSGDGPWFVDHADRLGARAVATLVAAAIAGGRKLYLASRRVDGWRLARHLAAGNAQMLPPELLLWRRGALAGPSEAKLTLGQMALIERLTEGWAAPAMLLTQYTARGGTHDDEGISLADSHVADFIDEEILAAFSREWRDCVVALSLADEFDATLIERLGADRGLTIELLRSLLGPLMIHSGHGADWRFNRLLRQHLGLAFARLGKGARQTFRDIVTGWAAARGDVVAAATIIVAEGGRDRFLDLVAEAGGVTLWTTIGHHHLKKLVKIADDAGIDGDARFQLVRCACLLKEGRFAEAATLYDRARPGLPDTIEARRDAAFIKITLLIYGCKTPAPEDAPEIQFLDSFSFEEGWKTMLPTFRAIHHSQNARFDAAMGAILEATNHGIATGLDYNMLFLDVHRATILLAQGDLSAARKALLRSRLAWRREFRHDRGAETVMSALFAQLEFEAGKLRAATLHLKKSGSGVLESEAWLDIYVASLEPMFRLAAEQHGVAVTAVAIDRIRDQLRTKGLEPVANLMLGLRVAIEGEEWLRGTRRAPPGLADVALPEIAPDAAAWQEREFLTLAGAYVDMAAGALDRAVARLTPFIDFASGRNLKRSRLRALLLRAAALDRSGKTVEAAADFEEALAIGESTGLRRAFAEFGGRHTAMQLSRRAGAGGFVQGLGRSVRRTTSKGELSLTGRERQMIEALGLGKSDKAIGRDLGITEYGVRFHLRNLYAKLGVHDRAAAVTKATLLM